MAWTSRLFGMLQDDQGLSEEERKRLGYASLMDSGLAMLANSGYSYQPMTTGQALAQGLLAGRQTYGQGVKQTREQKAAQLAEQQRQAWLAQLEPSVRGFYEQMAAPDAVKMYLDQQNKKEIEELKARNRAPEGRTTLQKEASQLFPNDPKAQTAWIKQQRDKATGTTINLGGQPQDPISRIVTPEQRAIINANGGNLDPNVGYSWDKNNQPQPIGLTGPSNKQRELEAQKAADQPKAAARVRDALDTANRVQGTISEALPMVGRSSTGFGAGTLAEYGGTSARNLKAKLDTVKANLGFAELQKMRDNSPTGGALGQVAIQELDMLQSTIASLDQLQSAPEVEKALGKIDEHLANWKKAVQQSYSEQYPPQQPQGFRVIGVE